jgi:hypothetical protein
MGRCLDWGLVLHLKCNTAEPSKTVGGETPRLPAFLRLRSELNNSDESL